MYQNKDNIHNIPDTAQVPFGNYIVMLIMTTIFAVQMLGDPNQQYLSHLILQKATFSGFFGYLWLHTDPLHTTSNLILLAVLGRYACQKIGDANYILIYVLLGYCAAFAHVIYDGRPVIGASGAICGVLGLTAVLFYKKFSPFGPWLILFWVLISTTVALIGNSPVAHIAHMAGFIAGMTAALLLVIFNIADSTDTDPALLRMLRPATIRN